jgi:hypothetical protein
MNDDLIQEIGLLLTQLRYARRSLEDIERSTARYASFAFASALAAGPRFGEPPMFGGALKVYVVNINDLAPGGGVAGLLEGLLGGLGRLFGGFFGGILGGTIGGVALPYMIAQVEKIAATFERIGKQLGVPKEPVPGSEKAAQPSGGGSFFDKLDELKAVVDAFTALFQAAGGDTKKAVETSNPMTPEATRWLAIVQTADSLVRGIALVIKGLTLLIPEVIGTLAMLITRLDSIKLAVVELLQFILRQALLLRGVALTVLFDTLAAAAKLASSILAILGITIQDFISSIFKIFNVVLDAALAAIEFLSKGLAKTIDALLKWLVETVTTALSVIGDTRIFRVAVYALQTLPYILPPLVMLIRDTDISPADRKSLDDAKKFSVSGPSFTGPAAATLPPFPKISDSLLDPTAVKSLHDTIGKSEGSVTKLMGDLFGDTSKGLLKLGSKLDEAASDRVFNEALDKHIGSLRERSKTLADSLDLAQKATKAAVDHPPATGLEVIAKAYEDWLGSPEGLQKLLGNITKFISETPTSGPEGEKSLAAKAIGPTTIDRPRATVEIDDLVIELVPPPDGKLPGGVPGVMKALSDHSPEEFLEAIVELMHEMDERGMRFGPGSILMQA